MEHHTGRACFGTTTAMALVLAAMAAPVHAQETTTPLGRIVFGWGTDQVALDTPQAVTVIDQDEIERQQATTVGEIFDEVPGVQAIGSDRPLGQSFNIRGWGEVPAGDEGRVVVLQDGATQYYEQYRIGSFFSDPNLHCNIEVLRGPASATLYGAGAIGGVIRFETCDADDYLTEGQTSQFRFSLGGETNGAGGNAALRYAARVGENLDVFANLNYRQADDYVDGDGEVIAGSAFDAISGVVSGTYHFSGSRSLRVIYEAWNSDLDDTEYEQTGSGGFFGQIDRDTTDQTFSAIYTSAEAFGDLEVTLAYSTTQIAQENSTAPIPNVLFEDADYGYATLSLDSRVTTDFALGDTAGTLIYGVTLSQQERTAEAAVSGTVPFHNEGTGTRVAAFAQAEFDFGNGLVLVPGVRLEWARNEPGADNPGSTLDDGIETSEVISFSPKLAFTYDFGGEWGLFGSLSQTQRAPNLDELFSYSTPRPPGLASGRTAAGELDPETASSFELGFTYSTTGLASASDAFDARVTGFYTYVEDLITPGPDGGSERINVGEAEIYGVELEAAYAADAWYANFAATLIEGRNLTDDEVWSQLPQDSLSLTVGRRDAATGFGFGWTMNAYADIDYEGARGTAQNRYGGYATHDVFASYAPQEGALEGLEFRVGVDNVLDRTYRNALDQENGRGLTGRFTVARVWNF
ncbi:TonB-dependent receptor domain-containing protein [Gymnodinialimonas ceratoperidinii]|uniref:TonB-dependent receptor n=1 Tax=Gymnodinialimonas ceratoperidinii TaxID=2856823 RepID=A0A8F6TUZ8_9RHOB|nr:TonB-dependent receptor [Gymnodinialimonas ceratoperidinii]QXT38953.1 TonB-dependent receptor [Gymnodinialimonas ceratoperidinii]